MQSSSLVIVSIEKNDWSKIPFFLNVKQVFINVIPNNCWAVMQFVFWDGEKRMTFLTGWWRIAGTLIGVIRVRLNYNFVVLFFMNRVVVSEQDLKFF